MSLSSELISQFVKVTKEKSSDRSKTETTVYGTTVNYQGRIWVKIDGSDQLTPVSTTADTQPDERVIVTIKNHTATITGNISSPAARTDDVINLTGDVSDASKVATNYLYYDVQNGLQVGNKKTGSWSGFRTQITSSAFNILNEAGSTVASYGAKLIELGKNAVDAVISFCGGKGKIECATDESIEYLQLTSDNVRLKSDNMSSVYATYTDNSTRWEKSATNVSTTRVHMYASKCIEPSLSDMTEGWHTSDIILDPDKLTIISPGNVSFDAASVRDIHGEFLSVIEGASGIWRYKMWSNGDIELWGTYPITNMGCTIALGSMYRTDAFNPGSFPFKMEKPIMVASYESDGYGAMLWACSKTTSDKLPNYYLIRPTSATIVSGQINFHVTGKVVG